jgi:opacity protein-like surface antigen
MGFCQRKVFNVITRNILLLSVAAAMLATPASAGFYLGAQAGGALMRGDINYTDKNLQQDTMGHTRAMGAAFGAHLGYLYQLNSHMFVLGEGYFIKESGKSKSNDLTFQTTTSASSATTKGAFTVQPKSNYGAALGFGAFMNPKFNLYAKVGFESKGLTTTYTLPNASPANGTKKSAWSISPGAGCMYKITDSIAINPEYTYVVGKKYKVLPQTTNADGTYSKSINFTPTEHRLMLKLNYMFG